MHGYWIKSSPMIDLTSEHPPKPRNGDGMTRWARGEAQIEQMLENGELQRMLTVPEQMVHRG